MPIEPRRVGGVLLSIAVSLAIPVWPQSGSPAEEPGLSDPNALEVYEGDYTVKLDGQVVENLEIRGTLWIAANDVTVRNVWVYAESAWTVYVEEGSATFEHVEIGHPDFVGERGIGGANVTARLLDIHHVEDGIKLGSDSTYERIHVHDLASLSPEPHADAVQADGGSSNVMIRGSVLDSTGPLGNGNAAVLLKSDLGPIDSVTLTGNHLNGGGYTVFVEDGGHGYPSNVTFTDNTFGPDFRFGLTDMTEPVTWSGNTMETTGEEVGPDGMLTESGSVPEPAEPEASATTMAPTISTVGSGEQDTTGRPTPTPEPVDGLSGVDLAMWLVAAFVLGGALTWLWLVYRQKPRDVSRHDDESG